MDTGQSLANWDLIGGRKSVSEEVPSLLETQQAMALFLRLDVTPELLQPSCDHELVCDKSLRCEGDELQLQLGPRLFWACSHSAFGLLVSPRPPLV